MYKTVVLALALISVPLDGLAGQLTAVISPTGKLVLDPGCRGALTKALGELNLTVLPKQADAVTGDLVVNVKLKAGEGESQASCELLVFVTPTGKKLVTFDKPGQDQLAACRNAAKGLQGKLSDPLKQLQARGLPHVVVLRWNDRLQPNPAMRLNTFFLRLGIKAKPALQTKNNCTFRFDSKGSSREFGEQLHSFLQEHYRVASEPPSSLPQARRTFMYLLSKP